MSDSTPTPTPAPVLDRDARIRALGLSARNDRYNVLAARCRRWCAAAAVAMLGWAGTTVLCLEMWRHRSEIRTGYFVLSDRGLEALGQAQTIERSRPDVVRGFLETWVSDAFRVTGDLHDQRLRQMQSLYRTQGQARDRLNEWLEAGRNPYELIERGGTVEIDRPSIRILPVDAAAGQQTAWHVEFVEIERVPGRRARSWEVRLTVRLDFEGDARTRAEGRNPFGIWVRRLHMERFVMEKEKDR